MECVQDDDDLLYIRNKFPDKPKDQSSVEALQLKVLDVLINDFKRFTTKVTSGETYALASTQKEDYKSFDCYEGAGSYLTAYVWFLRLLENLSQTEDDVTGKIKEKLKSHGINESYLFHRAEIAEKTLWTLYEAMKGSLKKIQISYYFGAAGLCVNTCIISSFSDDSKNFITALKNLLLYKPIIQKNINNYHKEILYGVAGYLHCLLVVQGLAPKMHVPPEQTTALATDIKDHVELLIHEGIKSYGHQIDLDKLPKDFRLVYTFHDTEYFGAAHGLFGVYYILLKAYQQNNELFNKDQKFVNKLLKTVKASLAYLLSFQMSNGNFPSRKGKGSQHSAVQFCHGSPGAVQCLLLASEIFEGEELGKACSQGALFAGESIWHSGILKKGYGLCHGISGNGYGFLTLYRYTGDITWLYRAFCFVLTKNEKEYREIIDNYDFGDRFRQGVSDYPYSLMLGLSGDLCFEVDCLFPSSARFPGFEV